MPPTGQELNTIRAHLDAGRLDQAKRLLETFGAAHPRDGEVLWLRAELAVTCGAFDQAREQAREAEALAPISADQAYRLGLAFHRRSRPSEAATWYREALRREPRLLHAWCNLGAALQAAGQPAEAAGAYEHALNLKSDFPEVLGNLGNAHLALKHHAQAQAVLARAVALKPDLATAWNSLGIALKGLGRTDEAREAYETAIALQPGYAEAHANLGTWFNVGGQLEQAETAYRRALALAPGRPDVLNNLGAVLSGLGRHAEAERLLRDALAADPRSTDALCNLGNALLAADRIEEARTCLRSSIELKPDNVEALCNLGNSHLALNELDEALAFYERAEQAVRGHPEALFNQSLVHLARGDYSRGWPLYEHRFAARRGAPQRTFAGSTRLGPDTPVAGRTVLVYSEQGLGDTLQFARLLPALRAAGARVVVEVQEPLVGLIAGSALADAVHPTRRAPADYDLHCPLLSLGHVLGFNPLDQPASASYLRASDDLQARIRPQLDTTPRPRVGIVWSGNPKHRNDRRRSIALERLLGAFVGFEGTLVSLQRDRPAGDQATLAQSDRLVDLGPRFSDFSDTAAAVAQLDLVITVDTSVAHLSGALGVPTWVLLPFAPDWRWMLGREDCPWYSSMRLLRQPAVGDWDSVVQRIRADLVSVGERSR